MGKSRGKGRNKKAKNYGKKEQTETRENDNIFPLDDHVHHIPSSSDGFGVEGDQMPGYYEPNAIPTQKNTKSFKVPNQNCENSETSGYILSVLKKAWSDFKKAFVGDSEYEVPRNIYNFKVEKGDYKKESGGGALVLALSFVWCIFMFTPLLQCSYPNCQFDFKSIFKFSWLCVLVFSVVSLCGYFATWVRVLVFRYILPITIGFVTIAPVILIFNSPVLIHQTNVYLLTPIASGISGGIVWVYSICCGVFHSILGWISATLTPLSFIHTIYNNIPSFIPDFSMKMFSNFIPTFTFHTFWYSENLVLTGSEDDFSRSGGSSGGLWGDHRAILVFFIFQISTLYCYIHHHRIRIAIEFKKMFVDEGLYPLRRLYLLLFFLTCGLIPLHIFHFFILPRREHIDEYHDYIGITPIAATVILVVSVMCNGGFIWYIRRIAKTLQKKKITLVYSYGVMRDTYEYVVAR